MEMSDPTRLVSFTALADATADDVQLLAANERKLQANELGNHMLALLGTLRNANCGFRVDRLEHSLQTASRAWRDDASEETIVCALFHDIGEVLAPVDHPSFAAAILGPYVTEQNRWTVLHHGIFQGVYYWHHLGRDRNAREVYRGHPAFEATALFCERWDQPAFDPSYDTLPLEAFEPMVRRLFARPPVFRPPHI